ncbi:hypothetical protein AJ78_00768 [Emergomyces pasteurianus Ep9510]|uniref:DASH complex subunit DAD2 n=1 Tax=Emergomyces pasteurianus Ep9510 TaxID=1447872 RepID=A0A1J9PSK5_9EURO|nr:hypothetical protein AJ78_00768 [Emergomyces pasteurianus Ep9510]
MSRPTTVFSSTGTSSSLRQSSVPSLSSQQSSPLLARIASKRLELENLRQLRDVSGALASQMEALEEKLTTLKDGTEAVACVMANWGNVLGAIRMASTKVASASERDPDTQGREADKDSQQSPSLPSMLVRIPADQSGTSRRTEVDPQAGHDMNTK